MAKLTTAGRKRLKKSEFGLPGARGAKAGKGKYPMPDKAHAKNAKARAKQELDKGKLSRSQYNQIVAKANRMLGETGKKKGKKK